MKSPTPKRSPTSRHPKIFYRVREAAEMLSVGVGTIYAWISNGTLKAYRPEGVNVTLISAASLHALVRSMKGTTLEDEAQPIDICPLCGRPFAEGTDENV